MNVPAGIRACCDLDLMSKTAVSCLTPDEGGDDDNYDDNDDGKYNVGNVDNHIGRDDDKEGDYNRWFPFKNCPRISLAFHLLGFSPVCKFKCFLSFPTSTDS